MPNFTELKGIEILKNKLKEKGRMVKKSDNKTFDLIVDGKYAEVKTKSCSYNKLDFLPFTDKQYKQIREGNFFIFLVCNIKDPDNAEIYEFNSELLKNIEPKKYTSHEYNKSIIDSLNISKI